MCCQETLCPVDFQAPAQVGLEYPMLRFCPLPFHQDTSQVQLFSISLFQEMIVYLKKEGKDSLKKCVHQSLLPLFYHLYDENWCVAKASLETLLQATKFLKNRKFRRLLESDQLWRCSECLVGMFLKPEAQPEQALCPQYPRPVGLVAVPLPTPAPIASSLHPTCCFFLSACQLTNSLPDSFPHNPGHLWSPGQSCSLAADWHRGLLWREGSPLLPSNSGTIQLLECLSRRAQSWAQVPAGQGTGSVPTFPSCPCTVSSWWRTETQQMSTGASPWHTCRVHRSPCERWPSSSLVRHSPGCCTANRI
nr:uncharacterized protein LOC115491146 isoform X1 [Taeniopygia guttata]XP_030114344.1 uncharacterized protein LOC115491146 isoform X1 [Taeniopygia guttata]